MANNQRKVCDILIVEICTRPDNFQGKNDLLTIIIHKNTTLCIVWYQVVTKQKFKKTTEPVILNQCELGQLCCDWYYPNRKWQLRREWRMCYLLFVDYVAIRQSRREWLISI